MKSEPIDAFTRVVLKRERRTVLGSQLKLMIGRAGCEVGLLGSEEFILAPCWSETLQRLARVPEA